MQHDESIIWHSDGRFSNSAVLALQQELLSAVGNAHTQPRPPEELLPAQQSKLQMLPQAVFFLPGNTLQGDLVPLAGIGNLSFI